MTDSFTDAHGPRAWIVDDLFDLTWDDSQRYEIWRSDSPFPLSVDPGDLF